MSQLIDRNRERIREQMRSLEAKLTYEGNLMYGHREEIVTMNITELLQKLRESAIAAVDVLQAFQSKALELTKKVNCITEFIPESEEWAKACDEIPMEDRGPLHGLPVSIKENINIKGMDSSLGLEKNLDNPASAHATIVKILLKKGAIPFCKTNVCQTLYSFCCSNPVFGETTNPHDPARTPGGSSGGEAALIASGGSIFGLGTDYAGSVRIPASFSGCYGLRPSVNRFSSDGIRKAMEGSPEELSTVGFLGRNMEVIQTCMQALLEDDTMHTLDPKCPPIPWKEHHLNGSKTLVFGYFDSLSVFPSSPGVKRAVYEAKEALEAVGHKVIPFEIPDVHNLWIEIVKSYTSDGGKTLSRIIENEKIDPSLQKGMGVVLTPMYLKPFMKLYLKMKSQLSSELIQSECFKTPGLWQHCARKKRLYDEMIRRLKENNIDLLLSPVYAIPAPQSFHPSIIVPACIYSTMFSFFNFASFAVPVTKENEEDQKKLKDYPESDVLYSIAKAATRGATGLPIGVSISGRAWEEELVCTGALELERALKGP